MSANLIFNLFRINERERERENYIYGGILPTTYSHDKQLIINVNYTPQKMRNYVLR